MARTSKLGRNHGFGDLLHGNDNKSVVHCHINVVWKKEKLATEW